MIVETLIEQRLKTIEWQLTTMILFNLNKERHKMGLLSDDDYKQCLENMNKAINVR